MTVIHTVTADLNGDGVMVDITDRVDMTAGLTFNWGRTDWAAAEPIPGTLTLTLDNWDGALTPGSPTGIYTVGPAKGCAVYWDRREAGAGGTLAFTMGPPELVFPNGSAGSSQVVVQCIDVLAQLALRIQRGMYDETALHDVPAAYWPCNEPSGAVAALDQSGGSGPPLTAVGDAVGWAAGGGPPAAGDPTIYLQSGITDYDSAAAFGTYLHTETELSCDTSAGSPPTWTLEMWFTAAAIPQATAWDVVILAEVVCDGDFTIIIGGRPSLDGASMKLGVMSPLFPGYFDNFDITISTVATHFVSMTIWFTADLMTNFHVDGKDFFWGVTSGMVLPKTGNRPVAVTIGSAPHSRPFIPSQMPPYHVVCDWVGAVGKVALYPTAAHNPADRWHMGAAATADLEDDRLTRLLAYSGVDLTCSTIGPPMPDLLETQDTAGENMLTSIATALAVDGGRIFAAPDTAALSATAIPGRLQAIFGSAWRNYLPSLTIDVEGQAQGIPPMTKDATGRVSSATATSRNGSASFTDAKLVAQIGAVSASVKTALSDPVALGLAAQDRVELGHTPLVVAQQISIDLLTSPPPSGGWLATLIALTPGDRIRLAGLPAAILGYGQVDQYLIGGSENWTTEAAAVTFNLCAADAPVVGYTAPETSGLLPGLPDTYWRASGDATLLAAVDQAATVIQTAATGALFSTDPGDYPLLLALGGECVQVLGPPTLVDATTQQFTLVRGAGTTWPRPHRVGEPVDVWLAPTVTI